MQHKKNAHCILKGGLMTKHTSRKKRRQIERDTNHIVNNKFTMKRITPITENQENLFDSYQDGMNIAAIGSAGTGKTYVSLYLALEEVMKKDQYEKIIIVRSAVQSRNQGFMPGSLKQKMEYYETPYMEIVNNLFGRGDAYGIMKQKGMIDFMSTSFIRGMTFDNAIIILDEVQNCNFSEIDTVMTRVGENSKIVLCGDVRQDDLTNSRNRMDNSGLRDFLRVNSKMDSFDVVEFGTKDIVRSGLVREYIITKEKELETV